MFTSTHLYTWWRKTAEKTKCAHALLHHQVSWVHFNPMNTNPGNYLGNCIGYFIATSSSTATASSSTKTTWYLRHNHVEWCQDRLLFILLDHCQQSSLPHHSDYFQVPLPHKYCIVPTIQICCTSRLLMPQQIPLNHQGKNSERWEKVIQHFVEDVYTWCIHPLVGNKVLAFSGLQCNIV